MNVYTIYDSAAKYYFPIFLARTDDESIRMFAVSMGEKFIHRQDYTLFNIGEFSHENGNLKKAEPMLSVMNGLSLPDEWFPEQLPLPIDGIGTGNGFTNDELTKELKQ